MQRHSNRARELDGLLLPGKIRKRGSSPSASSSSSLVHNCRFKRAILVGKRGGSTTPVPTWRLVAGGGGGSTPSRRGSSIPSSPKSIVPGKGKQQQPVSARKLAATLWEMNEVPSPSVVDGKERRVRNKEGRPARDKAPPTRSVRSGSLPRHLSDPSHSPVSERMDRSGCGSRHRRTPSSLSQKLMLVDNHVGAFDSVSNASLMEIETRSRAQTPTGSTVGVKNRLKDVSTALTTSKELLKIIHRIWGNEDRPSSSLSLISALHAELERARLLINHFAQEQRSEQNEINYLMKRIAEEKASWENKEQKVVEAAIESVVGELEVEKMSRRRMESLNKKLGKELAETRASLFKVMKELENEKRARVAIEQVCDELAGDIGEDKAAAEGLKIESAELCEEDEKEREMLQFADALRKERVQMKLSGPKYHLEEKNAAVNNLRGQIEAFLGAKRTKDKARSTFNHMNEEEIGAYLSKALLSSHHNESSEEDGEVDNRVEFDHDSAQSDVHPIELSMDSSTSKSHKRNNHPSKAPLNFRMKATGKEEINGRYSTSSRVPLQRSTSDVFTMGAAHSDRIQYPDNAIELARYSAELERPVRGKDHEDLRARLLSGYKMDPSRQYASPTRQSAATRSMRDPNNIPHERHSMSPSDVLKSRLLEAARGEGLGSRMSKW